MAYTPAIPFDIPCISSANTKKYMLFDVELITWLRQEHHILGVLVGSLPQSPAQNIFLGLPQELMPEEARLLVEKGLARIVDDSAWFLKVARSGVVESKSEEYRKEVMRHSIEAAEDDRKAREVKKARGMRRMKLNQQTGANRKQLKESPPRADLEVDELFNGDDDDNARVTKPDTALLEPLAVTRASAGSLVQNGLLPGATPAETSSYLLFRILHDNGYFMSPGLKFGCQFMAYPGDPLRYHSHFLAVAYESKKSIPLIDIIGGGRLATAVKKSFLLGIVKSAGPAQDTARISTYSIEWAGM